MLFFRQAFWWPIRTPFQMSSGVSSLLLRVALTLGPLHMLGAQVESPAALRASPLAHPARLGITTPALLPASAIPATERWATPNRRPSHDRWFGADKFRHFGSCVAIQLIGYGALRVVGAGRSSALGGATVATIAASIWKERADARAGGRISGRDLVWDGAGIIVGSGLARFADMP